MSEFKYIIIQHGSYEYPIIFPDKLVHEDMARAVLSQEQFFPRGGKIAMVVSAGFINLDELDNHTDGYAIPDRRSDSLGLGPRKDDAALILMFRYGHGIAATVHDYPNHFSPRLDIPCYDETKPERTTVPKRSKLDRARDSKARL